MGVQTLLTNLAPCADGQTCTSSSSNAVDQVGIMVFPGLCSDTASGITTSTCPTLSSGATLTNTTVNTTYAPADVACPSTAPPITPYDNNPEYMLLGFQHDYQVTDGSGLNTSSAIVEAVGALNWIANDSSNTCGLSAPGGEGTFYAGAIVAAQTYLTNNHTKNVQDIMILLSDGNASADSAQMGGSVAQSVTFSGMNGSLYSPTAECQQAVNAATYAKDHKQSDGTATEIYSVSYGSETTGCTSGDTLTPCGTMQGISSLPLTQYFYSVPLAGETGGTVCSGAAQITKLDQVFEAISANLSSSRLIPASFVSSATWTAASQ